MFIIEGGGVSSKRGSTVSSNSPVTKFAKLSLNLWFVLERIRAVLNW